ncbi:uncharacterized protein CDAR_421941 [Caerostris darwini]|uniref:Gustatory receptor n=1 Tax=Caerostris darwini TaxID=1538125 RepID=A0AAV4VDD9_9ARAC|nr:uncharacterized protein CDAR_421941 [Caerostris darwini]
MHAIRTVPAIKIPRGAMRPVMFLFLLSGLISSKSNQKCRVILLITFHAIFLEILVLRVYCLCTDFTLGRLLSTLEKLLSLLMWWCVRLNIENITNLVEQLEAFVGHAGFQKSQKLFKISKRVVNGMVFIMFFIPALRIFHHLMSPTDLHSCILRMMPRSRCMTIITYFLYELSNSYINTAPLYAVCVFYSMFCFVFAASFLDKESPERQIKLKSIEIFKALEDTFSFIIFAVFTIFLFSFFKLIFLFSYMLKSSGTVVTYTYALNFASHLVLVVVVVLSADNVQQKMNHLYYKFSNDSDLDTALNPHYLNALEDHESWTLTGWRMFAVRKPLLLSLSAWLFTNPPYCKFSNDSDLDTALNPHYLNALEDHESWTLTGWRMFAVRKPLLLSLSAWLFTYAVIIIQFFYSPQN